MNRDALELLLRCTEELGLSLDSNQLEHFGVFADELKKWNRKINLTAIRDDRDIIVKHFADSLTLIGILKETGSLLDLGSGGGFPAIPLKIMLPRLSVVSVDAVEKKILFQRHAARLLKLHDFTALHARGEDLVKNHDVRFDYIVSRAFSDLPCFVSLALPLLKGSGRIIAMKGKGGEGDAAAASRALADLGVRILHCIPRKLPVTGDDRYLVVMGTKGSEDATADIP